MEEKAYYNSPLGLIEIKADDKAITSVSFIESVQPTISNSSSLLNSCIQQLDDYFQKKLKNFKLELSIQGTDFQKRVYKELLSIPHGGTISYIELARRIGNAKAVRAVGLANGKNKIAIIIPCHRVIGKNGQLVGFSGGLWRKEWLLKHEGKKLKHLKNDDQLMLL